ncbi:MAG: hypothetical protein DRP45_00110 [Candidatus Zixiibacteriota bacterium]|nr:MAG: hypothetical protein DRP45_00110 [candidate division Zixibacteria bacterium]
MKRLLKGHWPLALALIPYALLARSLSFIQDDAYISYRYVANYLNGHGLVYNIGEHVEGFTNFGWTVYMLLAGVLGIDFILVSRITGFLLGGGVIVVTYLIATMLFGRRDYWFAVAATLLVGVNQSLAYWSPAGLETAAFAFLAMLSLYLYLKRNWLLVFVLLLAVWMRPEGAVVTGLLIILEAVEEKRVPRFTLSCAALALVLSTPFVIFKLVYYGSILPNPFYAKTSFNLDQLYSGLEYAGRFFSHYGFYGVGYVLPLIFWKRLPNLARTIWLYTVLYTLYIVLIGGDVLKIHRFFLPLFGPASILMLLSVWVLIKEMVQANRRLILFLVGLGMLGLTYQLPKSFVNHYNLMERAFTEKMTFKAREMKKADERPFSVALATIGIFGYELLGHEIIDLVGLTDSTIARYSEEPIPGMETTWKEQKHNSRYLLQKAPDYIVFSTGIKPSAPAERALLLYRQFMDCYRTVGWFYRSRYSGGKGVICNAFKKIRPVDGEIVPVYPVQYVEYYKQALDAFGRQDHVTAIAYYDSAMAVSPKPYFIYLEYQRAFSMLMLKQFEVAVPMMSSILARDSTIFEAHADLYRIASYSRNMETAEIHKRWLIKLVPWYWPRVEESTRRMINAARKQ